MRSLWLQQLQKQEKELFSKGKTVLRANYTVRTLAKHTEVIAEEMLPLSVVGLCGIQRRQRGAL